MDVGSSYVQKWLPSKRYGELLAESRYSGEFRLGSDDGGVVRALVGGSARLKHAVILVRYATPFIAIEGTPKTSLLAGIPAAS